MASERTKLQIGLLLGGVVGAGLVAWSKMKSRELLDLENKVVLITGGSRGLGLALAREFGARGARVAICARDEAELVRARLDLSDRGIQAHSVVCDVADQDQVNSAFREIENVFGPVDVLVNNAGLIRVGPVGSMTIRDFQDAMNVMFWGPLYCTWAALPSMRARRQGSIVNITSIGGKVSVPHLLPYSCAKFSLVALSEGLCAELEPCGVRVTTIVPGLMRTGSHLKAEFKGKQAQEYAWFSAGAATYFASIGADRAARAVVNAAVRGDNEKILSVPADVMARLHGAFPELSSTVLGLVNRFLPSEGSQSSPVHTGADVQARTNSRIWDTFVAPGQRAAASLNEL